MKCIKFLLAFLLVAVLANTGWSQCPPTGNDAEAPTVTCAEFAMTYDDCPDGLGPNTPNGMWTPIGPTGGINNAVGGSYSLFLDLTTCVTDNCTDIEDMEYTLLASYSENVIPGCSIDLINEWQIRDASGNISSDVVTFRGTIAFTGTTPPVIVCPANIGVECGESLDPMDTGMATATSDCGDPDITFTDVLAPACGTTGIITRTWTATTGCGETSSCVQIITTFDTQLPVLPAAPSPATVECDAVPMPEVLMATDACAGMVMGVAADVTTPGACDNSYTITRTWTFTDACGNSDELSQEITVEDTTPPDVTCVEFTATFDRCPDPLGPNTPSGNWIAVPTNGTFQTAVGGSSIGTIDLNNCVTDNCSDFASGGFEYMASDSYEENRVPGCSVDIINEFMIRDICGNVSPTTFIFRGMIQFGGPAPVIVCPANATVECGAPTDPAATGEATSTSDCGDPAIAFTDTSLPGCGLTEVISRTWTATDGCGTVSACTQTITIVDTTPPVIVCPANATVECGDPTDPAATGGDATATDICGGATVAFAESSVPGCGLTEVISRTWTATDDCGNMSVCTQTITVEDTTPPDVTCTEFTETFIGCPDPIGPNTPSGNWIAIPANGMIATAVGGIYVFVMDVSNCLSDGCGDALEYMISDSYEENTVPGCSTDIINEFMIRDECGNVSPDIFNFRGTIQFDGPGPVITCPANLTVECDASTDPADTGMATATSDCGNPAIAFTDVSTQGQACAAYSYMITRTWTATDGCGTVSVCTQIITVEDTNPPVITCPANLTVECDQPTDPGATGNATATNDNCAPDAELTVVFSDVSNQTPTGCGNDSYTITRTWTASDPCGNATNCVQVITVEDTTPPTIICPANLTIECTEDTSPANTGTAIAVDNCTPAAEIIITFADVSVPGCGNTEVITRTWTATDACGNATNCVQIVTVEDTTPPVIITGGAGAQPNPPANANYTLDNTVASNYIPINVAANFIGNGDDVSFAVALGGSFSLYGNVVNALQVSSNGYVSVDPTDSGGDLSNDCPIPANPSTGPDAARLYVLHDDIDLDPATPGSGIYYQFFATSPYTHPNGSIMSASIIEWVGEHFPAGSAPTDLQFQAILFENGDVIYQYLQDAEDGLGSTIGAQQSAAGPALLIACNTAGTSVSAGAYGLSPYGGPLSNTPLPDIPAAVVECDGAGNLIDLNDWLTSNGGLAATDACGDVTWTNDFDGLSDDCGATGSATVFFTATDDCGNTSIQAATFVIEDTTAPIVTCPPSQTLTCFESLPAPAMNGADFIALCGTIDEDCSMLSEMIVFTQNVDNGGDNCPGNARVVVRTYFIQDACGNTSTCTQTFTYLASTQGPVITSVLPSCFKYCASLANPMESDITYDTDCSFGATVNITGPQNIGQENCPGSIARYTYTVTDDCGRTSTPVTRDFIIQNDGPTIECPAFNLLLECGDPNNSDYIAAHLGLVTANTSCELGYTISHFPQNFNNITCNTSTVVPFIATDACGRTASCTTTVNISDNTAPEITSVYEDGICNEAVCGSNLNFWYNEWKAKVLEGLSATDACDTNVSISAQGPNSPSQNCPDETTETVVNFVATDNCGNTSYIAYSFYVTALDTPEPPQTSSIAGMIHTEEMEAVEDVEVYLSGGASFFEMYVTGNDGMYAFSDVPLEQNYSVSPYSNQFPMNGVSSFDLILIAQHILSINQLDSPYKMIAADVNRSGSVTTLDLVELRKMILMIDTEFTNNNSWRFVDANFVFPYVENPFATAFPEIVNINGLFESVQHDFVGVKIGDVNGTVIPNTLTGGDDRSFNGDLPFNVQDVEMETGETYEVAFSSSEFEAIMGYQYTLNFDTDLLEFVEVQGGDLEGMSESNFGLSLLAEGAITTSWTNDRPLRLSEDEVLYYVNFTAKRATLLSEALSISSRYTKAEAYDVSTENGQLNLLNVTLRFDGALSTKFSLMQNTPNPFNDETVIGFILPEASFATMTVYDVSGRALKSIDGNYEAGYNEVSLDRGDLKSGMMYYTLTTSDRTLTKKMLLIDQK